MIAKAKSLNNSPLLLIGTLIIFFLPKLLIADARWRFDEFTYNGTSGEITDSSGFNNPGTSAFNTSTALGKVCQAIDFTANGTADYAIMNRDSLQGLTNFTFSVWIQTSATSTQQEILQGLGSSEADDEIEIALQGDDEIFVKIQDTNRTYTLATNQLTDGNWHHIAFTRSSDTVCLYIDGSLQQCQSGYPTGALNITNNALIIGQEQDSFGGSFSAAQDFEGLIDELHIFSGAFNAIQINNIYTNQDAGNNWDGSARTCPSIPSVADWHFDEFTYNQTANEIEDFSGNNFDGTSGFNTSNVAGQVCNASDLSANSNQDYLIMDESALQGLNDFTFSTWIQTSVSRGRQQVMQGLGTNANDEEVELYLRNTNRIRISIQNRRREFNISPNTFTDGAWHHVAFTRSGTNVCLYFDGALDQCRNDFNNGVMNIAAGSFILGQEQDSFGGSFNSNEDFEGLIDETLIFNSQFSAAQIASIYTNQSAGNNWDGSPRTCPVETPIADWHLDESNYDTSIGEILDSSGNNYHGEAGNPLTNVPGKICNAIDFTADSVNDFAVMDETAFNGLTDMTFSVWVNTSINTGWQQVIHGLGTDAQDNEFDVIMINNDELWLSFADFTNFIDYPANSLTDGNWHQITVTRAGDLTCAFIDGSPFVNNCQFTSAAALSITSGALILGQELESMPPGITFEPTRDFRGLIDEPLLFDRAKTNAEILAMYNNQNAGNNWDGTARTCPSNIDHYRLIYDGTGLTCEAEPITIKACNDSAATDPLCTNESAIPSTATLTAPASGWVGGNAIAFTGNTTKLLAVNTASTVTLAMSSTSPSAPVVCYQAGSIDPSCDFNFADTGFRFTNDTDANTTIPTQISAKPSNLGWNAKTLSLQAVRTDTNTGTCTGLFANGADVDIDLAYQCTNPATCTGNSLQVTNNSNTYNLSVNPTFSTHSLRFGADSKADLVLQYADAGELNLSAQKSIDLGAGVIETASGTSNNFVVRPFGLKIDTDNDANSANATANDENGSVFKKTGEAFTVTATAVGWVSGEDTNSDGVPDNLLALNDNPTAENVSGEQLNISQQALHPATPANGILSGSTNTQSFTNSVAQVTNLAWDEVGIIRLNASLVDSDYLGTGNLFGQLDNIGRFVPDHFTLVSASAIPSCTATATHTFFDQPFDLLIQLEAQNSNNIVTQNYRSGHDKATLAFVAENNNNGTDLSSRLGVTAPVWLNGVINSSLTSSFARLTPYAVDGPYSTLSLGVQVDDNEASAVIALSNTLNMNASTSGVCSGTGCNALELDNNLNFILGRVIMKNAYGPSTQTMLVPITTEYWNGSNWQPLDIDSCSTIAATSLTLSDTPVANFTASIDVQEIDNPATTVGSTNVLAASNTELTATAGAFDLLLDVPTYTTGDTGAVKVDLDMSGYPWLTYDWNNDGTADGAVPTIYATFGQFRGNDRIIYWREKR